VITLDTESFNNFFARVFCGGKELKSFISRRKFFNIIKLFDAS
jgi:hypothetical protein